MPTRQSWTGNGRSGSFPLRNRFFTEKKLAKFSDSKTIRFLKFWFELRQRISMQARSLRVGGSQHFFRSWVKKRVEEVLIRSSCEFEPDRSNGLEVTVIFRRECPKSTWHFRGFRTKQTTGYYEYLMLIGPKFFAANTIRRFQQSRDNQFWVSVWPTHDLKNAFFRADDDFFTVFFWFFQIFGICLIR